MKNGTKIFYRDYEKLREENKRLQEENKQLREENKQLREKVQSSEQEIKRLQNLCEQKQDEVRCLQKDAEVLKSRLKETESENNALKEGLARLTALQNLNSTNSGLPTGKTPIGKKKHIPNSRKKTGKNRGGQPGHPKAKLKAFEEKEVTEDAYHGYANCPVCNGELELDGERCKDELDYEVVVVKRRHHFQAYHCKACGRKISYPISSRLKEENQYGAHTQALALSLTNIGNVSMNKVGRIISGLSLGDVYPTDGYIAKLQKRAAGDLAGFKAELLTCCVSQKLLYWDDTVITIGAKHGCLRFYGNENLALYFAHQHKDKKGIDEDSVLPMLNAETTLMHDHLKLNYNQDYSFQNIECVEHLLRDLQKVTDHLKRNWSVQMKEHIQKAIHDHNTIIEEGGDGFTQEYIESFMAELHRILIEANLEHDRHETCYYYSEEAALITRIMEYKDNYFAWVTCFDLPVTNNLSERSLRASKTHMKVSGQFQSEEYAQYYATVLSYIETCRRNDVNEMTALLRLCDGKPYSVKELLDGSSAG